MSQFVIHSIKSGVFMALFYLVYYLFLSRDTSYMRNRIYLVGSMLASWLLPFVFIKLHFELRAPDMGGVTGNFDQVAASLSGLGQVSPSTGFDIASVFLVIYLSGIGIMVLRLLFAVARLLRLSLTNPVSERVVRVRNGMISSGFSALGLTFINDGLPESEKEKIILHERIHARLLHHIDTILCEVVVILQWINPFAYLMRYSLRAVHEYQTDKEFVNRTGSLREYQELIINQIFGTRSISIASCFSTTSLIKKRILMMTKKQTRPGAIVKMTIALPLITGAIVLFSCNENPEIPTMTLPEETGVAPTEKAEPAKAADSNFTFIARPAESPLTGSATDGKPVEYGEMIIVVDGKERNAEFLAEIPDSEIAAFRTLRPEQGLKIYGERAAAGVVHVITKAYIASQKDKGEDVFMIVEKMPTFQDGDVQKFSQWVGANVRYPETAHSKGIQGKVYIGFIVEPDGNVSNATVLRSVDKTLDDEAVRIVMSSPKWTPGYQRGEPVRVRFSITVNFRLENPEGK